MNEHKASYRRIGDRTGTPGTITGHRKADPHAYCVYTIYDKNDFPIIVDGKAQECADLLGISLASFYSTVSRAKKGLLRRRYILRRFIDEDGD